MFVCPTSERTFTCTTKPYLIGNKIHKMYPALTEDEYRGYIGGDFDLFDIYEY